jgi:hypothetical protein
MRSLNDFQLRRNIERVEEKKIQKIFFFLYFLNNKSAKRLK